MYTDQDSRYNKSNGGLHPEQRYRQNRSDHRNSCRMYIEEPYVRGKSPQYRRDDRIGRDNGENTQMGTRDERNRYNDHGENTQMGTRDERNRYNNHGSYRPRIDSRRGFQNTANASQRSLDRYEGNPRGFDTNNSSRHQYATGIYSRNNSRPRGNSSNRQYRSGSGPYGVGREHVGHQEHVGYERNYGHSEETRDAERVGLARNHETLEENPVPERMGIVRCEYGKDTTRSENIQSDYGTDTDVCEKKNTNACKANQSIDSETETSPKLESVERDATGGIDDNEDYVP
jgi:hypothetical protein